MKLSQSFPLPHVILYSVPFLLFLVVPAEPSHGIHSPLQSTFPSPTAISGWLGLKALEWSLQGLVLSAVVRYFNPAVPPPQSYPQCPVTTTTTIEHDNGNQRIQQLFSKIDQLEKTTTTALQQFQQEQEQSLTSTVESLHNQIIHVSTTLTSDIKDIVKTESTHILNTLNSMEQKQGSTLQDFQGQISTAIQNWDESMNYINGNITELIKTIGGQRSADLDDPQVSQNTSMSIPSILSSLPSILGSKILPEESHLFIPLIIVILSIILIVVVKLKAIVVPYFSSPPILPTNEVIDRPAKRSNGKSSLPIQSNEDPLEWLTHSQHNYYPNGGERRIQNFKTDLSKIFIKFYPHKQKDEMRSELTSTILPTLGNSNPRKPGTLFILYSRKEQDFESSLQVFLRKVGECVNSLYDKVNSRGEPKVIDFEKDGGANLRKELISYFGNGGKVVLIYSPNKISKGNSKERGGMREGVEYLKMFHAFCDNDSAFDKRAIYIFLMERSQPSSMQVNSSLSSSGLEVYSSYSEKSRILSSQLNQVWDFYPAEHRSAVIARITTNILVV